MRALRAFVRSHPHLVNWLILALGMTLLILAATQDKDLNTAQVAWLVVIGIGLAGFCAWVIGH